MGDQENVRAVERVVCRASRGISGGVEPVSEAAWKSSGQLSINRKIRRFIWSSIVAGRMSYVNRELLQVPNRDRPSRINYLGTVDIWTQNC